ncbi:hypothetical protein [Haloarcula brevis]|uniref:hypothetical protein n=1 Tax=Haloarcula brevis TaxID=3111453 RepID=UPI00300EC41C
MSDESITPDDIIKDKRTIETTVEIEAHQEIPITAVGELENEFTQKLLQLVRDFDGYQIELESTDVENEETIADVSLSAKTE